MTALRTTLAALATLTLATAAGAGIPKADVPGSADHPVLKRFSGSLLAGYAQQDWEQRTFPGTSGVAKDENAFVQPVSVEGKVTRLFYLSPLNKAPLEVHRNYQQALQAAGFKVTWQCETEAQGWPGPISRSTAANARTACAGPKATCRRRPTRAAPGT